MVQLHFKEEQIRAFFEARGFKVTISGFEQARTLYHNRTEFVEVDRLAVKHNGKNYDAEALFNEIIQNKLKSLLLAPGNTDAIIINSILNN